MTKNDLRVTAAMRHKLRREVTALGEALARRAAEVERLTAWLADLQSGMYINCVYCGHRYGPRETTPATTKEAAPTMAQVLKAHVEQCPEHPMSALKRTLARRDAELAEMVAALKAWQVRLAFVGHPGEPPDWSAVVAQTDAALAPAGGRPMTGRWDEKLPCWIIWGLSEQGVPMLLACDLSQAVADRHRRAVVAEGRWVRVYVESTVANHLYGDSMSTLRLNAEQIKRVRALPPQGEKTL